MIKTFAKERPNSFSINKLGLHLFELSIYDNIEDVTVIVDDETNQTETHYKYDLKMKRVTAINNDELKGEIIRLKFDTNKEMSLINKGISNPNNADYIAYREFVLDAKKFVDEENIFNS